MRAVAHRLSPADCAHCLGRGRGDTTRRTQSPMRVLFVSKHQEDAKVCKKPAWGPSSHCPRALVLRKSKGSASKAQFGSSSFQEL